MAITPLGASGRLSINYTAYGKPHVVRVWVAPFGVDPGVGTFDASGTPASLDALATDLADVIKPIYVAASSLSFGLWTGEKPLSLGAQTMSVVVTGNVTGVSATFGTGDNAPGAVSQASWAFRDIANHRMRIVLIGAQYFGAERKFYNDLGGGYKNFADYVLGSSRIMSRGGNGVASMLDLTFDTNDGLTRRYRR